VAAHSWVRLLRGTKVGLYAKMKLHTAARKPASATLRQFRWLGNLYHPNQIAIESSRTLFFPRRHGKLHVVNRSERRFSHADMLNDAGI